MPARHQGTAVVGSHPFMSGVLAGSCRFRAGRFEIRSRTSSVTNVISPLRTCALAALLVVPTSLASVAAADQRQPERATPRADPGPVQGDSDEQVLFEAGTEGYSCFRIPATVRTVEGTPGPDRGQRRHPRQSGSGGGPRIRPDLVAQHVQPR